MSPTLIAVGILLVAAVAVVAFLILNANRKRRSYENVPPAMRPAYSDEQLEKTVLERWMAWGLVLTLFFAVFLPVYWLNETNRLNAAQTGFFVSDVVRGEAEYEALCARCHGPEMGGGAAPSPYVGEDGQASAWPAPALDNIVARYAENRNIQDIATFIDETITQGRPGTPMPTWGAAYGGPLTDQQIDNITAYILANQVPEVEESAAAMGVSGEQLYVDNCLKCHGPDMMSEPGRPGRELVGVFERPSRDTLMGILRNGVIVPTGTDMPPWQNGYMYPGARYTDEALARIVDYLESRLAAPADGGEATEGAEPPTQGPEATEPEDTGGTVPGATEPGDTEQDATEPGAGVAVAQQTRS